MGKTKLKQKKFPGMEDNRRGIRPEVMVAQEAATEAERFQNEVLRPILKMQNGLLIAVFRHFMEKRKVRFGAIPRIAQLEQIGSSLGKDHHLRNLILGLVIGQFTVEEYSDYIRFEAEASRRIMSMILQRLEGQVEDI
jgi:hypothetical protein